MTIALGQIVDPADLVAIRTQAQSALSSAGQATSAAATALSSATTAQSVANGAATAANTALLSTAAGGLPNLTIAANVSGAAGSAQPVTMTALLDKTISSAIGGLLYRGAAGWTALPPGIAGQVLQSGGLGNPPTWLTLPTIPSTVAVAPGACSLTFGTATTTSQPVTISPASGTVTSYQIAVSKLANMTLAAGYSALPTNLSPTINGLTAATLYYYTVTAYNGNVAGPVSAVQSRTTQTAVVIPPGPTVSPSGTIVSTVGPTIYDANGVTWAINGSGQVTVNTVADATTANVIKIGYFGGFLYQENASLAWWFKAKPADPWVGTNDPTVTTLPPVVTDPTGTGTVLPGGSTNPPVVVPLTGTVNKVTKQYKVYNGMGYILIPPANYDASKRYPLVLYEHQDDWGNPYYTSGGQSGDIVGPAIDVWFNDPNFLKFFPCFVIATLANQTTQAYDGEINFGGYGNGVQIAQTNGIAIIKQTIAAYPIDTSRIYCTGSSMGATGTIVNMILNNTINGTIGKVFAAGLAMSGVDYDHSVNNVVNSSVVTQFQAGVPLISIHGASDTEQPAERFSLPLYNALGGTGGNAAGMALSKAGNSKYYLLIDSQQGHDTWDVYYVWPRIQPFFQQLFSYEASGTVVVTPPTTTASANNSVVTTVGSLLTDAAGSTWGFNGGGFMTRNGGALSNTANVVKLAYVNGVIWQQNTAGDWYSVVSIDGNGAVTFAGPQTTSPLTTTTPVGPGTGNFRIANGLVIDPNGNNFIARGINVYDFDANAGTVASNAACTPMLTLFPGLNFVRVPCYDYNTPSYYATFISRCTAKGIVVLLEHHVGAGGGSPVLTGSALTAESNWFASLANYYKSNSYVWFGTLNEPGPPGDQLTAQHVSNYNAIRGTGAANIVVHNTLGDYSTGILVVGSGHGLTPNSAYAAMTNIVWDMHIYNGLPHFQQGDGVSYSTNQTQLNAMVAEYMRQSATIPSADGQVPVLILEYGDSTNGQQVDPGGTQTCIAVQQSGHGCAAWNWASNAGGDNLTDGNNNLTAYGRQIAGWIASAAS